MNPQGVPAFVFTTRAPRGEPPFDPEASARETGHAHEIPPNVRRLSPDEIVAFNVWAAKATAERSQRRDVFGNLKLPVRRQALGGFPE